MSALPTPVDAPITEQLAAACTAYRDAREVLDRAAERWQHVITDAVEDYGLSIKNVAAEVGVSTARVHAIIARRLSLAS
jgi:ribosome-binding protein aMBF1 (putative translation factor)